MMRMHESWDVPPHRLIGTTKEHKQRNDFERELEHLINYYSQEEHSDTPDYILAQYLIRCLENYELTIASRDEFFGFKPFKNGLCLYVQTEAQP